MDYRADDYIKAISYYHMLNGKEDAFIMDEIQRFVKNDFVQYMEDQESIDDSEIADFCQNAFDDCISNRDNLCQLNNAKSLPKKLYEELESALTYTQTSNDNKPLKLQLACLWYFICSDENKQKAKVIKLLSEKWSIKQDIVIELQDTYETLLTVSEKSSKVIELMPDNKLAISITNLFKKNKSLPKREAAKREYADDEVMIHNSIKELIDTEGVFTHAYL